MDIERFRGKVQAVRVGVQPHARLNDLSGTIANPQIHVGHAKTFVTADLIAKALEVPLWVRYKWAPESLSQLVGPQSAAGHDSVTAAQGRVLRYAETLLVAKDQLTEMLGFLGIAPDRMYLPPQAAELPGDWSERILAIADRIAPPAAGWTWDARCEWYDAAVRNYPTLMVRGADWCAPLGAPGTLLYVAIEDGVFEAAGHEKFVMHLPLIMCGAKKMSTSHLNAVSWRVLMPMGRERASEWLIGDGETSKQWSWEDWSKAVKGHGVPTGDIGRL